MGRTLVAIPVVVALLVGQSFGLVAPLKGPAPDRAEAQFTAAETLLSKTGTIGTWAFREPPGSTPVECIFPVSTNQFRSISFPMPIVLPAQGFTTQTVRFAPKVYQRLPDGSRVLLRDLGSGFATTSFIAPHGPISFGTGADLGSTLVIVLEIAWLDGSMNAIGSVVLLYNQYQTTRLGPPDVVLRVTDACYPAMPALASLDITQGTVNQSIPFTIIRFPQNPAVTIYFDGEAIGSVATDSKGNAAGTFKVPAKPMGQHTVKFYRFGRQASAIFTIKPRIKIIPSSNVMRGQTVNVSLRGFAAHESVYIRWKKGNTFVQINHVTTSSTGSANINVHVPTWVPDDPTSVRGDGTYGHAQTNAVTVNGGPTSASAVKPSPIPTETPSPTPVVTHAPPTALPTVQPAVPTATATETATIEATTTPTATVEATETATYTPTATSTASPEG